MPKRKVSKAQERENKTFNVEIIGLILVLIGILSFGFGVVGAFLKKFALFLVGEWWPLLLIYIIIIGILMIFRKKLPKFSSSRHIGFFLIFIVILILSHLEFLKINGSFKGVMSATQDNFMERIATIGGTGPILSSGQGSITVGGGFIGAIFGGIFVQLFSYLGTIIVSIVVGIVGAVLLFNISIVDAFKKLREQVKKIKNQMYEEEDKDNKDTNDNEDEDYAVRKKDIVITSSDEPKITTPVLPLKEEVVDKPIDLEASVASVGPYNIPSITLLDLPKKEGKVNSTEHIKSDTEILERVLKEFGITGQVVEVHIGPAVTQYELHIQAGTKVSRIVSLNKEIALALAAKDVRIEAPIPGKNTVGIEIPNQVIAPVKIREVLGHIPESQKKGKIIVSLGKDIMGRVQTADISKMPHLLVAGSTGSGKSVCINSFIGSILMQYRPDEVKLVLVDPKKVELSNYNGVPHLLTPVVTDPKKASVALQKVVREMENRYHLFEEKGVKNILEYNELKNIDKKMFYLVVIIDELADLMVVAKNEVQDSIMRITQMARAAGIHLIVATQRPSTDVITGVVKSNIPSRISFAVASQIDSRTILDHSGAEKLLGKGDMLYLPMGENAPIRIQGCFISDDEIRRLIEYVTKEQKAQYDESMMSDDMEMSSSSGSDDDYEDPLYNEIVNFAYQTGRISASLLQRRFRLGYNRAARVVDLLEKRGVVGPANGSKPREVIQPTSGGDQQ